VVLLREAKICSDAGLVEQCQNGDSTAFDEIVRRYKDRVYNVVYRFVGNHEDALDVSQEVFVRAYRGLQGFQGSSKMYTWLYSIAANLARNRVRDGHRKGRDKGISLEGMQEAAPGVMQQKVETRETPRDEAQRNELDQILQQCLDELPDHYRIAFVLRTFEDLSYEEIADAMGCPPGTVKSRLNKARQLLRVRMEELKLV